MSNDAPDRDPVPAPPAETLIEKMLALPVPPTIATDDGFRDVYCQGYRHALNDVLKALRAELSPAPPAVVEPEWLTRWMSGEKMGASSGIVADEPTYGYGYLDNNGYFEIPVPAAFAEQLDRAYEALKLRAAERAAPSPADSGSYSMRVTVSPAPPAVPLHDPFDDLRADVFDFRAHLERQREWSKRTFGPGNRTAGVIDHIRKELLEIEAKPDDLSEWMDVAILALDGAWRVGYSPSAIIRALKAKQTKNEARTWPDWRTMPLDRAIEHTREGDQ